jgi:hypothetical protein
MYWYRLQIKWDYKKSIDVSEENIFSMSGVEKEQARKQCEGTS